MTSRKTKPKHWTESSIAKTIAWIVGVIFMILVGIPSALQALTDNAPKTRTNKPEFINSELGIFKVELCNESSNPISWEEGIDSYVTRLKLHDSAGKNIPIQVNYPTINTSEKPDCITLTGSVRGDFYGTGKFYTECDGNMTSWCSDWKDPGKYAYRSKRNYIVVDASPQSYDEAKTGEKYDSINPKVISNILENIIITQAPGNAAEIRDGVYQNPQKRVVICGNLTEEEKEYYKGLIRENFGQYTNDPLFCSRKELLTLQDADLRAFFGYIGDCEITTKERGRICTPDSRLYTRGLHENNPDSIVIVFPTISEDLKTK